MERISLRGGQKELRYLLEILSESEFCSTYVYPDDLNMDTEKCPTRDTSPARAKNICRRCWRRQLVPKIVTE